MCEKTQIVIFTSGLVKNSGPSMICTFFHQRIKMKVRIFFLLATLSLSALAQRQPERPCQEFDQKLNHTRSLLTNFETELRKLDNKVRNIEERLSARTQNLNSLIAQRERASDGMRSFTTEQLKLRQEVGRLQNEAANLRNILSSKETGRQYHASVAASSRDLAVKRENLRSSKLLEKEIGELAPQLSAMEQAQRSTSQRLSQLEQQYQLQTQAIGELNRQIELEQRDPAISRLQQERQQALQELGSFQGSQLALTEQVAKATQHVTMCHGYLELSVKYPTAVKAAKRLVKQGCANFKTLPGTEHELQAQDEVLAAACR